jgi:hypothetical protein
MKTMRAVHFMVFDRIASITRAYVGARVYAPYGG